MNYFISPPVYYDNLPPFLKKFIWKSLVKWADAEYLKRLDIAATYRKYKTHRILSSEWSGMRILSTLPNFRWLCANLDEKTWNYLDSHTRKFIEKAYTLYEGLREVRVN